MTDKTKTRIDAWDAQLSEAQRWQVYDRLRRSAWYVVSAWVKEEFGLSEGPSRSAIYRFSSRMRGLESAHRIESALLARDEAGALVAATTDDEATITAYKAMAQDLAIGGNADEAIKFTKMALNLAAQLTRTKEIQIKERDQNLREREVAIKEATSKELAIDLLIKEAGKNEKAKALLKQFVETLDQA